MHKYTCNGGRKPLIVTAPAKSMWLGSNFGNAYQESDCEGQWSDQLLSNRTSYFFRSLEGILLVVKPPEIGDCVKSWSR
jgi:hypothetical protein